ncbi:prolipoprotein diacylglyceryl transferase family protein [Actinopolymorpha singaporensis]|uniref:Prolipoprotein diacylglyceryltransferase n=1 Tax=Actinopolymorpha singaporensis TaxID=117157 RepID=A0A1H1RPA3_9ACTN|nr:prolipoprotein diacylglyceryl transferase family protein [Actinopolymorpha singaporensis]SDS37534.1 Prolipoprotein diacylglyceryltransferase [Actinopolymorpha singaporensis]
MNTVVNEPLPGGGFEPGNAPIPRRGRTSTAGIMAGYVAVFFGLLPLLLWSLGNSLNVALALPELPGRHWGVGGAALLGAGLAWMAWSMVLLRVVGGGWPVSHLPPVRLVTSGPYRLSRHPVYVGYVAAAAGLALLDRSPGELLACGLLALGVVDYVVGYEGPVLRRRFAGTYDQYQPRSRHLAHLLLPLWERVRGPVEWLANQPVLLRVGPTIWVTYGLFVASGTAVAMTLMLGRLATDGLGPHALLTYALVLVPSMALGGRLLWFVVAWEQVRTLGAWRAIRTVGLVSWGTYIGFFAGSAVFAAVEQVSLLWLLDRMVPTVLVCSVIGRIGCLTYGCCFGREWPHGIRWYAPESKVVRQLGPDRVCPRIPVQVLSAAATAAAVLTAALVSLRPAPAGVVTGVVMLLYAMGRFAVDSLRDETFGVPWAGGLTSGHLFSLVVTAVALALIHTSRGEPAWPRSMFSYDRGLLWPILPVIGVATILVFVVSGLHWRRVGQW